MTMAPGKVDGNGARKNAVVGVEVFLTEAPQISGNDARKSVVDGRLRLAEQMRLLSPATALEKVLDTCKSHVRWETPRGRYDECSRKFSLREETKVIEPVGLETAPAHNTTKKLCPNVTVRLSISPVAENKGLTV